MQLPAVSEWRPLRSSSSRTIQKEWMALGGDLISEIGASLKNDGHFHRQSLGRRLPLLTQEADSARSGGLSKVVPHWQREGSWHFFTPGPGCVLGDAPCKHTTSVIAELVNLGGFFFRLHPFPSSPWREHCRMRVHSQ